MRLRRSFALEMRTPLAALLLFPACSAEPASVGASSAPPGSGASGPGGVANYMPGSGGAPTASGGNPGVAPASGGAPTGAGGAAIISAPISEYDARVGFDWPESVSDGGPLCKAGHYVGTFTCNFVPALADGGAPPPGSPTTPFPVTGPVELILTESQNGEFLEVSGGTLNGAAFIAITFTGKISGKLDCQSKQFTGTVSDGSFGIQPFPPGGYFQGPTSATYSATGPALVNGSWQFAVQNPQGAPYGTCDGTWTVTYAP
jgi:hypothetical protein